MILICVFCLFFSGMNCDDGQGLLQNEMVEGSREKRNTINDALLSQHWQLQSDSDISMGVSDVWSRGITGKGIVIGIVDAGTDPTHTDLIDNYDADNSYDYVNSREYAAVDNSYVGYGVECAGLAVAKNTSDCVIGVAHGAKFVAIKILEVTNDEYRDLILDDVRISQAFSHGRSYIDIYSNSWGPVDDGASIDDADRMGAGAASALYDGVTMGRDGKGSIYVFSTGVGGINMDDCNINEYVQSPYTIAIGSVDMYGDGGDTAEECASMLAVTFGGNSNQTVITTANNDGCISTFFGAHAATPIAAGIIALVLEANNNLTWRDVQHLIVDHSQPIGDLSMYTTNGAGKQVSVQHGFGLMNASAMVRAAESWVPVSELLMWEGNIEQLYTYVAGVSNITNITFVEDCNITSLEHVEVYLNGAVKIRQFTEIWLKSPAGTYSRLLRERLFDTGSHLTFVWTLSSVHFWGENPTGVWQIEIYSSGDINEMMFYDWNLILRGTASSPTTTSTLPTTLSTEANTGATCGLTIWAAAVVALMTTVVWCWE